MLSDKQKVDLQIDWYTGACNPENPGQPDYRFQAGSLDGVYAKGDRSAMVDKAETENKRRVDLIKDKGLNEGPEGGSGTALTEPMKQALDMKGSAHTITVTPGPNWSREEQGRRYFAQIWSRARPPPARLP
jgi:hypothetical protein